MDINWHREMENCPNNAAVLIAYDSGDIRLIQADDNDTPWSLYYPLRHPKQAGVDYPEAWAIVTPPEGD